MAKNAWSVACAVGGRFGCPGGHEVPSACRPCRAAPGRPEPGLPVATTASASWPREGQPLPIGSSDGEGLRPSLRLWVRWRATARRRRSASRRPAWGPTCASSARRSIDPRPPLLTPPALAGKTRRLSPPLLDSGGALRWLRATRRGRGRPCVRPPPMAVTPPRRAIRGQFPLPPDCSACTAFKRQLPTRHLQSRDVRRTRGGADANQPSAIPPGNAAEVAEAERIPAACTAPATPPARPYQISRTRRPADRSYRSSSSSATRGPAAHPPAPLIAA